MGFLKKNEEIIEIINKEIQEHNDTFNNKKKEEWNLNKNLWRYFCSEILSDLERYKKDLKDLDEVEKNIA